MIMKRELTRQEQQEIITGEITLAAVMAIVAIAIAAVVVYKLFMSNKGTTAMPGGWKFTWN